MNGLAPRLLCARTLCRMVRAQGYGNLTLHSVLTQNACDPKDAALCTALFRSVWDHLLTLDACIAAQCKRPLHQLDTEVLCILRCGICELLYLHTPEAAVVNLWTEIAKKMRKSSATGMVNAILRGFLRSGKRIPLPEDTDAALSIQYSLPLPLFQELLRDYHREMVLQFLEDAQGEPPVYIRHNPLACSAETLCQEYPVEAVPGIPFAYRMTRGQLAESPCYHVQDLSSQLCCLALQPLPGETVLDVCAAPGGKTFTLAELMQNRGKILAYDLHESRVRLIQEGAKRLGLSCITAMAGDARTTEKIPADRILCDVPCSGFGVIRRKPEIRYKSLEAVAELPKIQFAILEASAKALKTGGVLVYSTCTVRKAENEEVVERFLAAHPSFALERVWQDIPEIAPFGQEMTTLFPAMLGTDGFFLARMRKRE